MIIVLSVMIVIVVVVVVAVVTLVAVVSVTMTLAVVVVVAVLVVVVVAVVVAAVVMVVVVVVIVIVVVVVVCIVAGLCRHTIESGSIQRGYVVVLIGLPLWFFPVPVECPLQISLFVLKSLSHVLVGNKMEPSSYLRDIGSKKKEEKKQ